MGCIEGDISPVRLTAWLAWILWKVLNHCEPQTAAAALCLLWLHSMGLRRHQGEVSDQWLDRTWDYWPIRCKRNIASDQALCPVRQCSVNDTRRAVQDKESEKNPFLVTIKADLVHLAIMGFNFINIMMIIFSLGKHFLYTWYIGQKLFKYSGMLAQKGLHILPFFVSLTSCIKSNKKQGMSSFSLPKLH